MNAPLYVLVVAGMPLVAACGGDVTPAGTQGGGGEVSGTMTNTYFLEAGPPLDQPVDLTATPVRALVWGGGAWTTYPGTAKSDGTFTVPGVPSGPFVLAVGASYVRTEARTLDLGTELLGRPDIVVAQQTDTFSVSVANLLAPTQEWDWVGLSNINGGGSTITGNLSVGATSLVAEGTTGCVGGLVDSSKGDLLHVYQEDVTGPYDQVVIVRHTALAGIEQHAGTTMVSGTFDDVPLTESLTLDFRGSEFAAQASAINPGFLGPNVWLNLRTTPGASQVATPWAAAPRLLSLNLATATDVQLSSVPYGNPFPAAWGSTVEAYQWTSITASPPGHNVWFDAYVGVRMPLDEATAGPIRPEVSPIRAFQIAGQDAFGTPTATGLVPTIAWDPPVLGTPSAYRVVVWSAGSCQHLARWGCTPDATIVTTETSVVMPPGVLTAGAPYQVVVTAEVAPIDATTKPFRHGPRLAWADALSNRATP